MNATISRSLVRYLAAPVAAAGIIGGAALSMSAIANAAQPACTFTGNATQCQTPGNVQINTQTGDAGQYAAQQQYPFGYGYGGGLLFHHRWHR
jgi:hypothetical protein